MQDLRDLFQVKARSIVLNAENDVVSVLHVGVDIDFPAGPLERIVEQIAGHFVKILFLTSHGEVAGNIDAEVDLLVGVNLAEHGAKIVDMRR